jgi:Leucine-rich repeat (LRR) protein
LFTNKLTDVPESIIKLTKLQILSLSNNNFTHFPNSILQLKNLRYLYLDNNQLTNIPDSIDQLTKLEYLVLGYNQLNAIPNSISNLKKLKYLYLANNKLTSLPKSVLNNKKKLDIKDSSYQLDNLSLECEFLIFSELNKPLDNLPYNCQEIWLHNSIVKYEIKLPFGCEVKRF